MPPPDATAAVAGTINRSSAGSMNSAQTKIAMPVTTFSRLSSSDPSRNAIA